MGHVRFDDIAWGVSATRNLIVVAVVVRVDGASFCGSRVFHLHILVPMAAVLAFTTGSVARLHQTATDDHRRRA